MPVEGATDFVQFYLGDQIVFIFGKTNLPWVGCLDGSRGDCPVVQTLTMTHVSGMPTRKITGYIGSIGGNIPQEYITYIIEYRGGYLIFTLYALDRGVEVDRYDVIWPLAPEDIEVFERIIASLELGDILDSTVESTPTVDAQPNPMASSYWVEMEDPHYGVRFAVPCFWSVVFPELYRPGGIGYPIWNYTEEFARSFGKNKSAFWETGAMKIEM